MAGILDDIFEDFTKAPEEKKEEPDKKEEEQETQKEKEGPEEPEDGKEKETDKPLGNVLFPTGKAWDEFKKGHGAAGA